MAAQFSDLVTFILFFFSISLRSTWRCFAEHSLGMSGLGYRSTAACLLGLRIQNPPGAWMSVSCVCWVLSSKRHCDEPIPRLEVSYLTRARVTECDEGLI